MTTTIDRGNYSWIIEENLTPLFNDTTRYHILEQAFASAPVLASDGVAGVFAIFIEGNIFSILIHNTNNKINIFVGDRLVQGMSKLMKLEKV